MHFFILRIDITIDCKGPCNGTIIFSISNQQPENIQDKKSNPAEGSIPFATSGDSVPVNVSSDIGLVIEAGKLLLKIKPLINYLIFSFYESECPSRN